VSSYAARPPRYERTNVREARVRAFVLRGRAAAMNIAALAARAAASGAGGPQLALLVRPPQAAAREPAATPGGGLREA